MKKNKKKNNSDFYGEGKHQKAKQNFLNKKGPKGNKGNMKWKDFSSEI